MGACVNSIHDTIQCRTEQSADGEIFLSSFRHAGLGDVGKEGPQRSSKQLFP